MIRAYVWRIQNDWGQQLSMVEFAYNKAVHNSIEYTPFYLCYGRHPVTLATLLAQAKTNNEAAEEFIGKLHDELDQVIKNLKHAEERQKHYADKKRRGVDFNIGNEALLSM